MPVHTTASWQLGPPSQGAFEVQGPPTELLCKAVLSILWVPAGCIRSFIYLTIVATQERLTQLFSGQVYPTKWGEAISTVFSYTITGA